MLSWKSPIHFPCRAPQPTHSHFLSVAFPCTGTYDLCKTKGLSSQWWLTSPSSAKYAARDISSGVLVSSYCCSSYSIADPFSSLGTFSSSSIGGPVFHPIDDCEHPLLYLSITGIASYETAISRSLQQNLAGICNSVWVWWLIMGWIPQWGSLWIVHPFIFAPNFVSETPFMGILFPILRSYIFINQWVIIDKQWNAYAFINIYNIIFYDVTLYTYYNKQTGQALRSQCYWFFCLFVCFVF
jgi:hypothetical protein